MLRKRSHHSEKPAHKQSSPTHNLKKAAMNTQHSQKWIKLKKKNQLTSSNHCCKDEVLSKCLTIPERGRQNMFAKIALFVRSSNWLMLPDHLPCLLRNLYAGQEATVRTLHGTTDGFKIGKDKAVYCYPVYFNLHAEYIIWSVPWMNHKLESRLPRKKSNHLRYADDTTLTAESKDELKSLLWGWKREWKCWLKLHSKN